MKTVILCGGRGIRLASETEYRPKPLVEIGSKPILWHIMKIYESQGFKEFVLSLGYKGHMIKDYFLNLKDRSHDIYLDLKSGSHVPLNDNSDLEGKIEFIDTGQDAQTGARISKIRKQINEDHFFMTYGDGVANIDLKKLYEHHIKMEKERGIIGTVTAVHPYYKFGILNVEDGLVTEFNEKPKHSSYVNGGFMVFNKKFFDYLSDDDKCTLEQEPLKNLSRESKLGYYPHEGYWQCMDSQKELELLNQEFVRGAPWILKK